MSSNVKNITIGALIAALLLSLGLAGYFYFKSNEQVAIVEETEENYAELESLKSELDSVYQATLQDLDQSISDNEELNMLVDLQKEELRDAKIEIERLIRDGGSKRELQSAKRMINSMKAQRESLLSKIDSLNQQNQVLAVENNSLTEESQTLKTVINEERVLHQEEKSQFEELNNLLTDENVSMKKRLEIGTALAATDFEVVAEKETSSGRFKKTSRADKAKNIRVCYDVLPNDATTDNVQYNKLRIIQPNNQVLYDESLGSGTFVSTKENELKYTKTKRFEYSGTKKEVCVNWSQNKPYLEGLYKAEIYDNDHLVGETTFELK